MEIKYFDAHCHIQFEQYAQDDIELIEQMRADGVAGVVVGVDYESSKKAIALAEKHEHLFASVGLHPNHVKDIVSPSSDEGLTMSRIRKLAENPKVVAIGECGLDYFRPAEVNEEIKNKQKEILQKHIELSAELDKPLIIHARPSKGTMDAYHDLIEILKDARTAHGVAVRGDIHFFVGGIKEAEALVKLGFTISFTAVITFARNYDAVIRAIPLTSILSETDSPYVAPSSRRGKRNDPLAVVDVVAKIAGVRNEDSETIRTTLLANAKRLFTLKN